MQPGKASKQFYKNPTFFQGGWLHALCICFWLRSQSFSDLFQQYDLRWRASHHSTYSIMRQPECMHSLFVFACGPKVSQIFSNNMTWDTRHRVIQHIQSCDNHHPEKKVGCGCHLLFRQFLSKRRRRKSRHIACVWFFFLQHSQGNDVGLCFLFLFFS